MAAAASSALTIADLSGLLSRIDVLERRFMNYISTESAIQEAKDVQRILDKVHTYMPTVSAKATDLKYVYTPFGVLLTDLDGCIVISTKPSKPNRRNTYKNNTLGFNPASDFARTLIVESKHSLTKPKIDNKIFQMCQLKDVFRALPTLDFARTSSAFQTMIDDHAFQTYPSDFYILFAADDMGWNIRQFIMALSEGITKEAYDTYSLQFLKGDPYYKTIKKNPTILKRLKVALHSAKTVEDANAVLADDAFEPYRLTFSQILKPYDAIAPYYNQLRNRIGFLQFNTLYLPELFPYPMPSHYMGAFSGF
jgi:hypothetical protein